MTKLRALVGLIIVAVIVYSGLWYTSAFQAEKDAAARLAALRDEGLRVEHGKIKLSGFPYRMVLTIDGLSVRTRGPGLNLGAESVTLISHLWTPGHWLVEAANVRLEAFDDTVRFTDGMISGSYRARDNGTTVIVLDTLSAEDFALEAAPGATRVTSLEKWQLFLRTRDTSEAEASGLYEERYLDFKLTLSGGGVDFSVEGGIMGPIIRDWTAEALGVWRDAGGLMTLDRFSLSRGNAALSGDASLTLDETFRPLGSASLHVRDGEAIGKALENAVGLEVTPALKQAEGGGDPVSLMLQMGSVTIDGQQLMPLKPLVGD
jgi:hypothetical protein